MPINQSARTINGLDTINVDTLDLNSATGKIRLSGNEGSVGQVIKRKNDGLAWEDETDTDTVGINLTADNTGSSSLEFVFSGDATATNKRDFNTSLPTFIPSTNLLTVGNINISNKVEINGGFGTAGQVLQVNSGGTALEYATPASGDTGIDLTQDNTGATNYEFVLSADNVATDKTDFKTSVINFQPSTRTLGVQNINLLTSTTSKIEINGSFGSAGQLLKVNSGGTGLEYANEATAQVGIDLTNDTTSATAYRLVLSDDATATNKEDFNTGSIQFQPSTNALIGTNLQFTELRLPTTGQIKVNNSFGTAGQILKVNGSGTALIYANDDNDDTIGINLTEDNTGSTNYELVLSGDATATDKRNFLTSSLNYQPSTNTLTASKVSVDELLLPTSNKIRINNLFGSATQILRVNSGGTALEYANETDTVGINLTEDNSTSTNYEIVLSGDATASDKRDFKTSTLNYQPDTSTLTSSKVSADEILLPTTGKVKINGSFGTAGQIIKVNSGATALEFATDAAGSVGIDLTEDNGGGTAYDFVLSGDATATGKTNFKTSTLTFQPSTSKLSVGNVNLSNKIEIGGSFGTAGQILKVNSGATALEYANETDTDTVGINLTEDNTGTTNYEIMLSGSATASNERDFKTSGINFQPSTNKLTVGNVDISNKIEIGSSFGTAGQILKVNSGATALEYANETDTIGINLTENTTSSINFDFLLHNGATATNDRNFNTSSLSYQPSTDKLTVGNVNLSNKIEIGGAFGTAGQVLKVNSGATALEYANETDTDTVGINLTEDNTGSSALEFVMSADATASDKRNFLTTQLNYTPSQDKLAVGRINLVGNNTLTFGGSFGTAGQIIKVNSGGTALEYANETDTDTVGINLTEDNTGTTNYEIMLSGTATASNERDFKTSTLNYQPSTSTLTASKVSSDEILLPTANAIKVNGSFGSAGQVLQVNSGATGLEYATPSTGSSLDVVASSSSSAIPILFQTAGTGVSQVLNKSGFTFKPSTSELVAGSMTVNNVSLTTTGQLICNSGVFNIDRSPAADVRIMFKSGGTDKWRIGNQASDDLFNIQNLTLTTTPFSIKADDTIVLNGALEYTGVQYFKNTNGDVQMSLEQSGAITITETLGVGVVNTNRDLKVGDDGLEVNGPSFFNETVYLQHVEDFTGSSTCFVPILRPGTGNQTSGTFKNDGITFTANTQTLNIKNLNFVASSSKIQLEGADGNNQFLKVNSSGALEFSSGSGGGVNVADDTTSGERPVVFSNAATPASTLGINSNLTYQPNSGAFKFKGDNVFSVGVGGEAAQQGAQIQFDSRYGEAGPNKISLFQTGGGGYGFGVDASTLKHLSPADHVFFTGSANDSNGNEALVINDDDEFIFAPSSTARVLGTTGSAKSFFAGRMVIGSSTAGIWFKDDDDPSTVITSGNPFIGLNGDGNWRVYINGNKLNINQNGTQTHTIASNYARFQASSTEFTQIRRYGIETQRSTAYLRPANTGNGTLYIGNIFTNGRKYNNIRYAATSESGAHRFFMGGVDGGTASGQRVVLGYGTGNTFNGFGFTTPGFRISCNGVCSATSFNTTSDARVKKNIVDYADDKCLEVIRTIPIKKYDYTDDYRTEDGEQREQVVGFLADDLVDNPELLGVVDKRDMYEEQEEETYEYDEEGEVISETPAENAKVKYKDLMSVDKPRLVAFTIGAIKSLDATIQQQQSTITQLQEEIAIIKSHLNI